MQPTSAGAPLKSKKTRAGSGVEDDEITGTDKLSSKMKAALILTTPPALTESEEAELVKKNMQKIVNYV
jgi:hypothetical protein